MRRSPAPKNFLPLPRHWQKTAVVLWILFGLFANSAHATDLKPETVAAFNHYIAVTEAQMNGDAGGNQFLIVDRLPDLQRQNAYDELHRNQVYIEELYTQEDHQPISVPNGLIHHWAGVIFIPKATLSETIAVLKDYENQPNIYKPALRKAKVISQSGDDSKIFEQFYSKSIITVVLNAYFDVAVTPLGRNRSRSVSRSTRIAEVVNFGTPDEHERTDGKDHGYMWRLNSYWHIEEKDGGVYVQNESISLSRTVPAMLGWLINPLIKSIPRDVLSHTLTNTQKAVQMSAKAPREEGLPERNH